MIGTTTLHQGKSRTATVIFYNSAGAIVPPPNGWELNGASQALDGGNTQLNSGPISVTLKCVSIQKKGDYEPPIPVRVVVYIALPDGRQIQAISQVGLLDALSSAPDQGIPDNTPVRAELKWGPEQ